MNSAQLALQRIRDARAGRVTSLLVGGISAGVNTPAAKPAHLALAERAEEGKRVLTEARRIRALPTWDRARMLEEARPGGPLDLTERFRVPGGTMVLNPIQNLALHWIERVRGGVIPAAVGSGKTIVSLLAPIAIGALRPILFIPPTLQIPVRREIDRLSRHFQMPRNLYIIPYSQLSVASSTALLEQLRPDLIVCDEAHCVRNPDAARTKRVIRYFRQFPTTRLVALSGTLTSRSLRDYAHLCELALREGSPVPTEEADLIAWANCIDADSDPQDKDWSLFAAFADVRGVPSEDRRDAAREVFRQRFVSTPGVVATTEASVQCSLYFHERQVQVPATVTEALARLHETWCRPDGEEMESALDLWRLGVQVSQGFYLRWVWPDGIVDHEWLGARAQWHREIRYVLQRNATGLDSPFLVKVAVRNGHLTERAIRLAWEAWEGVKDRPVPPTEVVWIDDYLVRDAELWSREHPAGILWYTDRAMGVALRAAGVPTYGAGQTAPVEDTGRFALSTRVHGTGTDHLQDHHSECLVLAWPSSGSACEQVIGRVHRQGQQADEVGVWYYAHTSDARRNVETSREKAQYIQDTQGSPQKLCYGTYL